MLNYSKFLREKKDAFWVEAERLKEKFPYVDNNVKDWEYDGKYSALEMARYIVGDYKKYKTEIDKLIKKHFGNNITVYRTSGLFGTNKKNKMVSVSLNKNYGNKFSIPLKHIVFIGGESEEELIVDSKYMKEE
jgi:hypothetical protein